MHGVIEGGRGRGRGRECGAWGRGQCSWCEWCHGWVDESARGGGERGTAGVAERGCGADAGGGGGGRRSVDVHAVARGLGSVLGDGTDERGCRCE